MKKLGSIIIYSIALLPNLALAFEKNIKGIAQYVGDIISTALIPFLITLALAWFIWGVVSFIRAAENSDEREKGKKRMLWGIIALFAMISFIGISAIFTTTFFNENPILPQLYTNT
jgi:uncharacterized membrane protein YidH (DUF202 family)